MSDESSVPAVVLPYATPAGLDRRDVWREGNLVVKPTGEVLPMRCVACNAPAQHRYRMNFIYYPVMRLVLSMTYRNISVPLCEEHTRRARRRRIGGVAMQGAGIWLILNGIAAVGHGWIDGSLVSILVVIGLFVIGGGQYLSKYRTGLQLSRVTRNHLYFKGAGKPFLDSLPESVTTA